MHVRPQKPAAVEAKRALSTSAAIGPSDAPVVRVWPFGCWYFWWFFETFCVFGRALRSLVMFGVFFLFVLVISLFLFPFRCFGPCLICWSWAFLDALDFGMAAFAGADSLQTSPLLRLLHLVAFRFLRAVLRTRRASKFAATSRCTKLLKVKGH